MTEIGSESPDFSLKNQNSKKVKFSSFKGKKVLLSFRSLALDTCLSGPDEIVGGQLRSSYGTKHRSSEYRSGFRTIKQSLGGVDGYHKNKSAIRFLAAW